MFVSKDPSVHANKRHQRERGHSSGDATSVGGAPSAAPPSRSKTAVAVWILRGLIFMSILNSGLNSPQCPSSWANVVSAGLPKKSMQLPKSAWGEPAAFDCISLNLEWPSTFVRNGPNGDMKTLNKHINDNGYMFTVHNLYLRKKYSLNAQITNCEDSPDKWEEKEAAVKKIDSISKYWPSFFELHTNEEFWEIRFKKHGACFFRYLRLRIEDYFSKAIGLAIKLTQALNETTADDQVPTFEFRAGKEFEYKSFKKDVKLLLATIHPFKFLILCTNLEGKKKQNTIESIELCFDYNKVLGRFVPKDCSWNEKLNHKCVDRVRLPGRPT